LAYKTLSVLNGWRIPKVKKVHIAPEMQDHVDAGIFLAVLRPESVAEAMVQGIEAHHHRGDVDQRGKEVGDPCRTVPG
jgi:hypothetical protein